MVFLRGDAADARGWMRGRCSASASRKRMSSKEPSGEGGLRGGAEGGWDGAESDALGLGLRNEFRDRTATLVYLSWGPENAA